MKFAILALLSTAAAVKLTQRPAAVKLAQLGEVEFTEEEFKEVAGDDGLVDAAEFLAVELSAYPDYEITAEETAAFTEAFNAIAS